MAAKAIPEGYHTVTPYLAVDNASEVLQYRVPVVSGLGDGRVLVGAQQHRIGAVDAHEAQLA